MLRRAAMPGSGKWVRAGAVARALAVALAVAPAAPTIAQVIYDPELDGPPSPESEPSTARDHDGSEEIIMDPELAEPPGDRPNQSGDEHIVDPELGSDSSGSSDFDGFGSAARRNGDVRVVLHSRVGVDTTFDDPREDVLEATQMALFEATVRRSQELRFRVGLRALHMFATREHETADANAQRYELSVLPTAAYADVTAAPTVHLRLGYQLSQLGRFDMLGASDILSVRDIRQGPATLPEASEIAQPALRIDHDPTSWLSLKLIYVPFFQPHLVRPVDGDYALSPARQSDFDDNAAALIAAADAEISAEQLFAQLRQSLTRSGQARLQQGVFDAFAPDPDLGKPQAALRLDARGLEGELGVTFGLARERLPAVVLGPALRELFDPRIGDVVEDEILAVLAELQPLSVVYNQYGLIAVDGALPVDSVQLGLELAYMEDRTFFAQQGGALPSAGRTDLGQVTARVEWIQGSNWAVVAEGLFQYTLDEPSEGRWLFMEGGRSLFGGIAYVAHSRDQGGLTLELGAGAFNGPTYIIAPRAELRLVEALFVELGAFVIGGAGRRPTDPNLTIGGLYSDTDQVYLGLRWLP